MCVALWSIYSIALLPWSRRKVPNSGHIEFLGVGAWGKNYKQLDTEKCKLIIPNVFSFHFLCVSLDEKLEILVWHNILERTAWKHSSSSTNSDDLCASEEVALTRWFVGRHSQFKQFFQWNYVSKSTISTKFNSQFQPNLEAKLISEALT